MLTKSPVRKKKKNNRVLLACNRCKKKKKKCDGRQPCRSCKGVEAQCIYETSRSYFPTTSIEIQHNVDTKIDELNRLRDELANAKVKIRFQNDRIKKLEESQTNDSDRPSINGINGQPQDISMQSQEKKSPFARITFATAIMKILYHDQNERNEYIGSFAILSISKAIRNLLGAPRKPKPPPVFLDGDYQYPYGIPISIEADFLKNFLNISHNRYMIIRPGDIKKVFGQKTSERSPWEEFYLSISLGIGCRLVGLLHVTSYLSPEFYFRNAMKHLSDANLNSLQKIQACALIAIFVGKCYNNFFYLSSWELIGMAMRMLIQNGFHRKKEVTIEGCVEYEFMKRLFWSVYDYEKALSLSMGRPTSINDEFIDIPLPLSIELADNPTKQDVTLLYKTQKMQQDGVDFVQPITRLTSFIQTSIIRQIESRTHILFYSVNTLIPNADSFELIMNSIEKWHADIPPRATFEKTMEGKESYDYFEVLYHRARLLLLLPKMMLGSHKQRASLLKSACASASGICDGYMGMHEDSVLVFSMFAFHTAFLAGVTMVYYIRFNGYSHFLKLRSSMRSCSNLLLMFSERWPEGKVYQDIFDTLWDFVETKMGEKENIVDSEKDFNLKEHNYFHAQEEANNFSWMDDGFNEDFWSQIMSDITK
ncbi:DEBR0S1_34464g1_1 [Brettanomyces bruxellensis]|uniref:DEBR0S1_34464g1_1 n=3 Tax=Dekkera bruxellensis TaxID=5007 RepID=A0A7D9CWB4_DEKBR|nr:DEBR0S1_34464g1_1 [Brettanomyces bruxellensis]